MPSSRALSTLGVFLAFTALTGCPEEDTRLFDETGVWTLEKYTLDGSPFSDVDQNRKNRFLLRFKPEDGVLASAACHEMGTEVSVGGSTCVNAGLSEWECRCFAYTYENDDMRWQEFEPNTTPPTVGSSGTGGDSETEEEGGGGGGDAHSLTVAAFENAASTYQFISLPNTLFNSDGQVSKHVFQIKADSVWTEVDVNTDGTPDLEACSMSCFPSEGNAGSSGGDGDGDGDGG